MRATATLFLSALLASPCTAAPREDLQPFFEAVRELVLKHYPKAFITVRDSELHFEFNTRKYMIHEPLLTGEWQDASEEVGPQKGGVVGDIAAESGPYEGQAVVPQEVDKRYFVLRVSAPYSKKLDRHLWVRLKYPRDASKDFTRDFAELVDRFEALVR